MLPRAFTALRLTRQRLPGVLAAPRWSPHAVTTKHAARSMRVCFSTAAEAAPETKPETENPATKIVPAAAEMDYEVDTLVDETAVKTMVHGYGTNCFEVNDVLMQGSIFLLPNVTLLFKPTRVEEITVENLTLLKYLRPTPDIIIFGTGDEVRQPSVEVRNFLDSLGMLYECARTKNACSTFNILNNENREVAGLMLPVTVDKKELLLDQERYSDKFSTLRGPGLRS